MKDFFRDLEQAEIEFMGTTVNVPIFYRDAGVYATVLPASVRKLKRLLPDSRFSPAQIVPGVGAVILIVIEYRDTDAGSYNEFVVSIPLNSPDYMAIPAYNLLRSLSGRIFHPYMHFLYVTTEIACRLGKDFYNFPKSVGEIEFTDSGKWLTCDVADKGEKVLTFSCKKIRTRSLGEWTFIGNLYQFRRPHHAEFKGNALEAMLNVNPRDVRLKLNESHPVGRELSKLVLTTRPFGYMYAPRVQAVLNAPYNFPLSLIRTVLPFITERTDIDA